MVLDNLGGSLKDTLSKIRNSLTVDRNLVEEILKEIQKALLSSDVNVRLVLEVTKRIRERAINERNENLTKKEQRKIEKIINGHANKKSCTYFNRYMETCSI
jgi:signal recognition particle subunit SRP54